MVQAEFEESIIEDLALLGIKADATSYTSDFFDQLHIYCVQMIKSGHAYADDTEQEKVRVTQAAEVPMLEQTFQTSSLLLRRCVTSVCTVSLLLVASPQLKSRSLDSPRWPPDQRRDADGAFVPKFRPTTRTRLSVIPSSTVATCCRIIVLGQYQSEVPVMCVTPFLLTHHTPVADLQHTIQDVPNL